MARLDQERQKRLEPKRIQFAKDKLEDLGFDVTIIGKRIEFQHEGSLVRFFPYSGWATGKTINDGRGINNLLKQLEK